MHNYTNEPPLFNESQVCFRVAQRTNIWCAYQRHPRNVMRSFVLIARKLHQLSVNSKCVHQAHSMVINSELSNCQRSESELLKTLLNRSLKGKMPLWWQRGSLQSNKNESVSKQPRDLKHTALVGVATISMLACSQNILHVTSWLKQPLKVRWF